MASTAAQGGLPLTPRKQSGYKVPFTADPQDLVKTKYGKSNLHAFTGSLLIDSEVEAGSLPDSMKLVWRQPGELTGQFGRHPKSLGAGLTWSV
jgi:hypothetical protein